MPERNPDLLVEDILAAIGKIERYTSGIIALTSSSSAIWGISAPGTRPGSSTCLSQMTKARRSSDISGTWSQSIRAATPPVNCLGS